jgi:hypothetical protein
MLKAKIAQHKKNAMKSIIIAILFCMSSFGFSQSNYFKRDTLAININNTTGESQYFLGDIWYLSKRSNNDSLTFTRKFNKLKSEAKFQFYEVGDCIVESNLLTSGNWATSFFTNYNIKANKIDFIKSNDWLSYLIGVYIILEYSNETMVLIKEKS